MDFCRHTCAYTAAIEGVFAPTLVARVWNFAHVTRDQGVVAFAISTWLTRIPK
jgi:hypothetical protein